MRAFICRIIGHRWLSTGWYHSPYRVGWDRSLKCERCGVVHAQMTFNTGKPLDTINN